MIFACHNPEILRDVIDEWVITCNDGIFDLKANTDNVIDHLYMMLKTPETLLLVLMDEQRPIGFIGVTTFISPISNNKMANEHLWYVKEKSRGKESLQLVIDAMKWAKSIGCTHFLGNASMLASNLHDQVCKIYKEFGMTKFETTFIKTLEV